MTLFTRLLKSPALLAVLFCFVSVSWADELVIPVGQQGADKSSIERPKTGMTDKKVEAKFGAPLNRSTPIGKPPISKWEYSEYWVYFEGDRVINTVLKPMASEADVTPAPGPVAEPTPPITEPTPPVTEPTPPATDTTPPVVDKPEAEPAADSAQTGDKPADSLAK